jgi:hypothetical protein
MDVYATHAANIGLDMRMEIKIAIYILVFHCKSDTRKG